MQKKHKKFAKGKMFNVPLQRQSRKHRYTAKRPEKYELSTEKFAYLRKNHYLCSELCPYAN